MTRHFRTAGRGGGSRGDTLYVIHIFLLLLALHLLLLLALLLQLPLSQGIHSFLFELLLLLQAQSVWLHIHMHPLLRLNCCFTALWCTVLQLHFLLQHSWTRVWRGSALGNVGLQYTSVNPPKLTRLVFVNCMFANGA